MVRLVWEEGRIARGVFTLVWSATATDPPHPFGRKALERTFDLLVTVFLRLGVLM